MMEEMLRAGQALEQEAAEAEARRQQEEARLGGNGRVFTCSTNRSDKGVLAG